MTNTNQVAIDRIARLKILDRRMHRLQASIEAIEEEVEACREEGILEEEMLFEAIKSGDLCIEDYNDEVGDYPPGVTICSCPNCEKETN